MSRCATVTCMAASTIVIGSPTMPEPDFTLTLAADQFTVDVGATLEIPVTVTRLNGFAQAIEVRAVDLPAGVQCETIKVDTAANAALKLVGGKVEVGGAFRVEGTAGFSRAANFKPPAFGIPTENFWVTVRPPKK